MTTSGGPQALEEDAADGQESAADRSALSFLLAAIPLGLVVSYQFGLVGMVLRIAPVLIFGAAWRLLPPAVRVRTWATWMLLLGGLGGLMAVHIVLELQR